MYDKGTGTCHIPVDMTGACPLVIHVPVPLSYPLINRLNLLTQYDIVSRLALIINLEELHGYKEYHFTNDA